MVKETLDVIRERGLSSSEVSLPTQGHLRSRIKRLLGRSSTNAYVASKRGSIDVDRVEAVVGGCKTANIGAGSVEHVTDGFVVIQP